jgi:S1-C subfamily serine protease
MQKFLIRSLFLVLLLSAAESWALAKCKRGLLSLGAIKYHNCQGTKTYDDTMVRNGGKYAGEWKDGLHHGQGTYADGRIYEGVWENDKFLYAQKIAPRKVPKITPRKAPTVIADDGEAIAAASGTGFAVTRSGHIVTNHHVINGCNDC